MMINERELQAPILDKIEEVKQALRTQLNKIILENKFDTLNKEQKVGHILDLVEAAAALDIYIAFIEHSHNELPDYKKMLTEIKDAFKQMGLNPPPDMGCKCGRHKKDSE